MQAREREFLDTKPRIGEPIPEVQIYNSDGTPFNTSDLKGHYTVLTFGCLTCPPSIWNISGLEAVSRDYSPKGVKFYFIFKSLAHPELVGDYVQAFTMEERLAQAQQAIQRFGTTVPWLVDAIDNRLKHALGDRPNGQFLIDPNGIVVRKRHWSQPDQVRRDLEELVGPVERITREQDVHLNLGVPRKSPAPRGVVKRIQRLSYQPLDLIPEPADVKYYAKLRAEAEPSLITGGAGKLYLGFHLDPLHNAHWNNLSQPLSFRIESSQGIELDQFSGAAPMIEPVTDCDPREFLVEVSSWPADQPLKLTVTYFACVGEKECHAIKQHYTIHRRRDRDGGGARGKGAGFWDLEEFADRLLSGDRDGDKRLVMSECVGLLRPHFVKIDANHDGYLSRDELVIVGNWLNHDHEPSPGKAESVKPRQQD